MMKTIRSCDETELKREVNKLGKNCVIEKYLAYAIVYDNIIAIALLNQVIREHNIVFTKEELLLEIYTADIYKNYIHVNNEYPNPVPYRKLDSKEKDEIYLEYLNGRIY